MRGASKPIVLAAFTLAFACFAAGGDLFGHGGRFRGPATKVDDSDPDNQQNIKPTSINFPGSGPEIPFESSLWEFWWYFNRDPLLELKPTLFAGLTRMFE